MAGIVRGEERRWQGEMVKEFFLVVGDTAFWFQLLCVGIFTVAMLGYKEKNKFKWSVQAGKLAFCMVIFAAMNILFFVLSKYSKIFAGIGFWFAYLVGIGLFAIFFCEYDRKAKTVIAVAVFSIANVVGELGSTLGTILEYHVDGFNSLYTKLAADLLLIFAAWILRKRPVSKYEVSDYMERVNLTCGVAASMVVIVYDMFLIHVLDRNGVDFVNYKILMFIVLLF